MEPERMETLLRDFYDRGWAVVRGALPPAAVASFLADVSEDLHALTNAESGAAFKAGVRLESPDTWPRGRARRVAECAPPSGRSHWDALASSRPLLDALDAILGRGCWEMPMNATEPSTSKLTGPRHWYAPVVFPEADDVPGLTAAAGRGGSGHKKASPTSATAALTDDDPAFDFSSSGGGENACAPAASAAPVAIDGPAAFPGGCPGPRRALHISCDEEVGLHGPVNDAAAHLRWQPVSRRRFLNKGAHIDIGPGFPNEGIRTPAGDPRQGLVLLVLLTDWAPGGGGTAMLPGSHFWVLRELQRVAAAGGGGGGISHQDLNSAMVARLRTATEAGRVVLACGCGDASHAADAALASVAAPAPAVSDASAHRAPTARLGGACTLLDLDASVDTTAAPVRVAQVVGRAGDVVLMHPLLLHSGTANMRSTPRVMVNGMVAVTREAYDTDGGCRVMLRTAQRLEELLLQQQQPPATT